MDPILIFDTTLRDGEQAPGFSMDLPEKLQLARALARLRVDVIEAGFPASSPQDFESVQAVAREVGTGPGSPVICGLARCMESDIVRTAEAVAPAARGRIHLFLATSDLHLEAKLGIGREEALARIAEGVLRARSFTDDVEFSPEDASRTDFAFLCEAVRTALEAGARTINVPDTVGYATPVDWADSLRRLRAAVPELDDAVLSVHCHDDLGLGVANSLAGVEAGARQVECTINGIGERAGNAALEEVVMALRTRADHYGVTTAIETTELHSASRLLSHITGVHVPPNKSIVGANAFSHEAGIHQHGVMADRRTYEIMRPEDVGCPEGELVLGKHSGRHALVARLEALGLTVDDSEIGSVFDRFKELCGRKKQVYDGDLFALVSDQQHDTPMRWHVGYLHAISGTAVAPTATVRLDGPGGEQWGTAVGDGPVDAALKAVDSATGVTAPVVSYAARAASPGRDAQGETVVTIESKGRRISGRGLSTDTVEAAARAYVDALCRAFPVAFDAPKPQETSATAG